MLRRGWCCSHIIWPTLDRQPPSYSADPPRPCPDPSHFETNSDTVEFLTIFTAESFDAAHGRHLPANLRSTNTTILISLPTNIPTGQFFLVANWKTASDATSITAQHFCHSRIIINHATLACPSGGRLPFLVYLDAFSLPVVQANGASTEKSTCLKIARSPGLRTDRSIQRSSGAKCRIPFLVLCFLHTLTSDIQTPSLVPLLPLYLTCNLLPPFDRFLSFPRHVPRYTMFVSSSPRIHANLIPLQQKKTSPNPSNSRQKKKGRVI